MVQIVRDLYHKHKHVSSSQWWSFSFPELKWEVRISFPFRHPFSLFSPPLPWTTCHCGMVPSVFTGFSKKPVVQRFFVVRLHIGLLGGPDRPRTWFGLLPVGPSVRSGPNNCGCVPCVLAGPAHADCCHVVVIFMALFGSLVQGLETKKWTKF